ncbi:MAG: cysteine--tRNA ligase [Nitrososphaeraceae archaeon]
MSIKLYNTLSRKYEVLHIDNNAIKIYLCGLTVYDDAHIGHARTLIIFDVLHRFLLSQSYKVIFIQNFTDIDDKIIKKAKLLNVTPKEIAEEYIDHYYKDSVDLNILDQVRYPKATDHISEMIALIKYLIDNNYAYITLNGIYFEVKKFSQYGKLSKKTSQNIEAGARIEIDPLKKDPLDFALWKFSSDSTVWDSPWGKGRPGWHIECSAMALKHLGNTVDVHGGGNDLIFPHHENEIAQSESKTGIDFVKIWMHCGMVNINSEKMSKSIGNIITIRNAISEWGTNTIRLLCLSTQYSKPLEYTRDNLIEAQSKWRMIETVFSELTSPIITEDESFDNSILSHDILESVKNYLKADLNTQAALSEFMKFISLLNDIATKERITTKMSNILLPILKEILYIFGLKIVKLSTIDIEEINKLILTRNHFRKNKEFEKSDELRRQLKEKYSIELIDHKNYRTIWKKVEK